MSNGLDALAGMRNKRTSTRTIPPPRNPPRATAVQLPTQSAAPEQAAEEPQIAPSASPLPQATPPAELPPVHEVPLTKVSIYVDPNSDEFLESVRSAGRKSRPKIDASRSAVVRFALTQLAAAMTPEQIAQKLQEQAGHYGGTGRRRL